MARTLRWPMVVPRTCEQKGSAPRDGRTDLGKRVERTGRRLLQALLPLVIPTRPNGRIPPPSAVRSILLVRPNFRLGNALLATAWLPALRTVFPHAAIDVLVGDTAAALFEGHAVRRVHVVSRRFVWSPWSFAAFLLRLRAERYDLALDAAMKGLSGPLYSWLSGASHRMGPEGRWNPLLTARVNMPKRLNVYDRAPVLCRALGWDAVPYPSHPVAPCEDVAARAELRRMGLERRDGVIAFLGVFVGGHGAKRWPSHNWIEVTRRLSREHAPAVVFVGPEERHILKDLLRACGPTVHILSPHPLRIFASMLAHATLLITPDSGPMHLAVALRVPVIPIVQTRRSFGFVPPGFRHRTLFRPTAQEVVTAVREDPAWPGHASCDATG